MRAGGLLIVLMLLALAAPATDAAPLGDLQARQMRTLDLAVAAGAAKAIAVTAPTDGPVSGHDLRITAERIVVVTNEAWSNATVFGAAPKTETRSAPPQAHEDATVATTRVGERFDLTIIPADGQVRIESLGGTALPSADPVVEGGRHVDDPDQPPLWATVQATVVWLPSGDVSIRLEGDFSLSVWDWDLRVSGRDLRSGFFRDTTVGSLGVSLLSQDYSAEQFLQVENGTLDLRVPDGRAARAYLARLGVSTDGALALSGASGDLPTADGVRALDGTIILEGGVAIELRTLKDSLVADVLQADSLRADGAVVPLAFASDNGPASPLPWLLGLLGAVPLVAAAWRSVVLTRARRVTLLRMDAGRYELALHGSRGLLRSRRHRIFARTVRTVALLRLGRPAEARQLLDERHWQGPLAASRLYLLAHASALEGDRDAAQRHLQAGLALDRGLRADAATNPTLRPLLERTLASREGYT
ncbi:MAG: hypothetical protein QOD77_1757 [Thermoplasmata archaeon]|jgi:hypothetical protein|nr:hypothetical protein [Thermoplasmata archaeon]